MNETGRREPGARSRMWGTAFAAALLLGLSSPVLAKDHPGQGGQGGQGVQGGPPAGAPGPPQSVLDKKAAKEQAKLEKQAAQQQAKVDKQAAKPQQQASKQTSKQTGPRRAPSSPAASASPRARQAAATTASSTQAAIPVTTTAAPVAAPAAPSSTAAQRTAARRAAARRRAAIHRRALARRRAAAARRAAARRAAARRTAVTATPVAAAPTTTATIVPAAATPAATTPAKSPAKPAPKPAAKREAARPSRGPVTVVTHTVRDIVHVIPGWAKALILALAILLAVAALLIAAAALRNRHLRALSRRLLDEVGTLSAALLPVIPERVGLLAVSVAYRPAEGLAAGGDFYDVFPLERGRVGIIVGDVSGHGRESLGPATYINHMVRSYLEAGLAPRAALQLAGKVVDEHNRDDFATVVAAVHDPSAGTLSYATAGHPPPISIGPGAHRPLTVASAPPLGVDEPTGIRQTTVPIAPGSSVCFFTDGLIEARRGGAILGMTRVERMVRELGEDATAERVVERIRREAESMPDDVAVACIRVEGGAPSASTLRVEEIEVTRDELTGTRLQRFLDACGIHEEERAEVIKAARAPATKYGSVVLRVRLADDRSGVDILPVHSTAPGGELTALRA